MKIAVITPVYKEEKKIIERCNISVLKQNIKCDHIIVQDGDYQFNLKNLKAEIFRSSISNDNGNTPRSIGTDYAIQNEYDYIAYLDADNFFHEKHIDNLLNKIQNFDVSTCFRTFHKENGEKINIMEDDDVLNKQHVDTSCYLISKKIFHYINIWKEIPKEVSQWCDRIFFNYLLHKKTNIKFTDAYTVSFTTLYENHYKRGGEKVPNNAKKFSINQEAINYFLTKKKSDEFYKKFGFTFFPPTI